MPLFFDQGNAGGKKKKKKKKERERERKSENMEIAVGLQPYGIFW